MMRRFVLPLSLVIVIAGFFLLAPTPGDYESDYMNMFARDRNVSAARASLRALGDTVRALNNALQRTEAWETARSLPVSFASTQFVALPGVIPETVREFENVARAEFAAIGAPQVPLRVVVSPSSERGGFYRKLVVLPQSADQPCVVVIQVPRERPAVAMPDKNDRLLGTCGFYAKFGRAGSGMQEWLESTRGIAAAMDTAVAANPRRSRPREMRGSQIAFEPEAAACVAGRDEDCALAILNPAGSNQLSPIVPANERTRAVVTATASLGWYGRGQTLGAIRAHVGDRAFEKIWQSSQSPAEAFQTVTGEHIAVFARPLLLRETLPHHPGPLRGGVPLLLSVALGATASLLAITRAQRQRS